MTRLLAELRGLQQIMFDLYDNPDLIHRIMTILRDGTMSMLDSLEEQGLLSPNGDGTYVGSGGLGWSNELPAADFDEKYGAPICGALPKARRRWASPQICLRNL